MPYGNRLIKSPDSSEFLDLEVLRVLGLHPDQTAFPGWRRNQANNPAQTAPTAFRLVPLQIRAFLLASFLPFTVISLFFFFYQTSRAGAGVDSAQPPPESVPA